MPLHGGGGGAHDSFDVHVSSQKKREGEGEGEGEEKALGIVAFSVWKLLQFWYALSLFCIIISKH